MFEFEFRDSSKLVFGSDRPSHQMQKQIPDQIRLQSQLRYKSVFFDSSLNPQVINCRKSKDD